MTQSKTLIAAAALFGSALAIAGMIAAPFNGEARAAAGQPGPELIAERIGGAFASIDLADVDQATRAALVRLPKGDLGVAGCEGQAWPNISADCLVTADGSTADNVRFVTFGYQAGEAETVLLRVPTSQTAAR